MKNEYNLPDYTIADIGPVSNLNVTTNDSGKIIEVKFRTNTETNVSKLKKQFEDLVQVEVPKLKSSDPFTIKFYQSKDENIFIAETTHNSPNLKNGAPRQEYGYGNKEAVAANRRVIESMISPSAKKKLDSIRNAAKVNLE
ncbi:MAG: hypothetical protein EOO50_14280 [Flavobacterium sp.]|uniref:hypothetical protein n=1 Tax=Flavobacterium sp. TaxID=239 RepID=UPI0011FEEE66|nr:hypothetical protein [Flavobacterium sp.]RZJ65342.1 MAG: hypothetical protein EOO50_14280 [Flavobacterium sp.]